MPDLPPAAIEAAAKEQFAIGVEIQDGRDPWDGADRQSPDEWEAFRSDSTRILAAVLAACSVLGLSEDQLKMVIDWRSDIYAALLPDEEETLGKLRAALASIREASSDT